ncbi:MAG: hypothetical protein ACXV95_11175 [Acidimicrobiales bacterium]
MGVDDRFGRGEGGGGELAADLDVTVGGLADAQAAGAVQPRVPGGFVLGGAGGRADLVGRGPGLAQVVAGLGRVEQAMLSSWVGPRGIRHRLGLVGGDLAVGERGLGGRAVVEPPGRVEGPLGLRLRRPVLRRQPIGRRVGPGRIGVAGLGPPGQQQLRGLEPTDHHRQPLDPIRGIGPRHDRRIEPRAPHLGHPLDRAQIDEIDEIVAGIGSRGGRGHATRLANRRSRGNQNQLETLRTWSIDDEEGTGDT